ncbi:MAG: hypothetical protein QOJ81_1054 [Chloroflexota bacterium]|nr:hypothetical protein [Chloroflexota bacterium]
MTNTTPPFTNTFELTTDDLVDYLRVAQRTLNSIGMAAGIAGMAYGAYLGWQGDIPLGGVLAAMGAFLFLISATRYADRLRARSIGRRIIGTQATFSIDEGGIDSNTVAGHAHASWAVVDNVMESPEMIVLRRGRMTVLWMPKRAMGSPAERDATLEFIRAHVTGITR